MQLLGVFVAGLLFALGLGISGMTQPQKIIAFLDVTGDWDPSLALVMGGALITFGGMHRLVLRRPGPLYGGSFRIPEGRDLDARLLSGAAIFGVGWGLGGFCPGPALVSLLSGAPAVFLFVGSMLVGIGIAEYGLGAPVPRTTPSGPVAGAVDG